MTLPTNIEIQSELDTLKQQVSKVRRFSSFGDDNRAKIEAQIAVIENGWDDDDIGQCVLPDHQNDAMEARYWLDGKSDEGSPSESWAHLCS